jgi:hypothetical protein
MSTAVTKETQLFHGSLYYIGLYVFLAIAIGEYAACTSKNPKQKWANRS